MSGSGAATINAAEGGARVARVALGGFGVSPRAHMRSMGVMPKIEKPASSVWITA